METKVYSYTRTYSIDYRDVIVPSGIAADIIEEVRGHAKVVLESFRADFLHPKWILVKKDSLLFWGVCCLNELLYEHEQTDVGHRPIRGCFGIVVKNNATDELSVPFDIQFFKQLYRKEVAPLQVDGQIHNPKENLGCSVNGRYNMVSANHNQFCDKLNTDEFICKSLGNVNVPQVIAAALTMQNVSLLIDNDTLEQAIGSDGSYKRRYSFMNCVSSFIVAQTVKVKKKCSVCGNLVDAFAHDCICEECAHKDDVSEQFKEEAGEDNDIHEINNYDEVDRLERLLRDTQNEIRYLSDKLKLKQRLNKILAMICVVLAITLAFSFECLYSSEPSKFATPSVESKHLLEKTNFYVNDSSDNLIVKWKRGIKPSSISNLTGKWAKICVVGDGFLVISIDSNKTKSERITKFEIAFQKEKQIVTIKQSAR